MNRARIFAVAAAITAGSALLPAVAHAAPTDNVPGTSCTVAQVERATEAIAPEAIAVMNETPGGREQAEKVLLASPAEREKLIAQLAKDNPAAAAYYKAHQGEVDAKITKIISTCNKY